MEDITKTGNQGYKALQTQNEEPYGRPGVPPTPRVRTFRPNQLGQWYEGPEQSPIMQQHQGEYWGSSRFDNATATQDEWEMMYKNPYEYRAQNQGALSKWGAGLAKGIGLAATTFLDGTVGLIYGVTNAISQGDVSRVWDNEISNSLQDFNQEMERVLPNYRTQEEIERPWYKNLGTANLWADGVLKNLGFTVGAYYSGAAWTKGLQAIGWVKRATSAQVVGSLLSGLNEGRIEANNGQREFLTLQNQMIDDARDRRAREIASMDIDDYEKIGMLRNLDGDIEKMKQDALERSHQMGLTTLIANTILLSADNMWQFGKLYSRGFNNAKGLAHRIEVGAAREGIEDVIEGGVRRYIPTATSKGAKIARGLSNGLVEGNEEMAQALIQSYAGHRQSYDSPDAYYEALTDPNARLQTKDFLTSLAQGFADSYGNGDRWEEFAIGAFTGLLGMPTFGKMNNSDANTWIGKGKTVGISGGVFGEYRNATQAETEAREAADVMNKYMEKIQTNAGYFAQSQSFTNAMDGFAAESNNFEYKNASNNDDFAAISRFARAGRLDDLKEMIKQDFENMSDEQLADIAVNTTPDMVLGSDGSVSTVNDNNETRVGGWRGVDGSLLSDTEEGREIMRSELAAKRDKILNEIDEYEKSVEVVRALGNNSLTEDQVNELAWLNWKVKVFNDRYGSLKSQDQDELTQLRNTIKNYLSEMDNADPESLSDDSKAVHRHMEILDDYLNYLITSQSAIQLGQTVENNPKIQEALNNPLIEALTGFDHEKFTQIMNDLQDMAKIGKAANQFNERYKEFSENPISLVNNRKKIDKKNQVVADVLDKEDKREKLRDATIPEIIHADELGDISLDEIEEAFSNDTEIKGKVQKAQEIKADHEKLSDILEDESIADEQTRRDAMTLLDNSKDIASDEQELLDLSREAFNDPSLLYDADDPTLKDIPSADEMQAVLNMRLDNAKTVLADAIQKLRDSHTSADEAIAGNPTPENIVKSEGNDEVGHDPVEKIIPVNTEAEEQSNPVIAARTQIMDEVEAEQPIPEDIRESYINDLDELIRLTGVLKGSGSDLGQTYNTLRETRMWKELAHYSPKTGEAFVKYLDSQFKKRPQAQQEATKNGQEEVENSYMPEQAEYEAQLNALNDDIGDTLPQEYKYWKPTITQYPIHNPRGGRMPFYTVARRMKKKDGSPRYTEQQLKRIEAVGEFLEKAYAFERVNSGGVQVGDKVGFRISKTLNEAAGEPVILMTDKDGNVIGDVMSQNDPTFNYQAGLKAFVDRVLQEYKDAGEPEVFDSSEHSVVDRNMVGKVPFTNTSSRNPLNAVYTDYNGVPVAFKLGIAMSDGPQAKMIGTPSRRKAQGQSEFDKTIIPALNAKNGQPFLLMPTSDKTGRKQFIPVPFTMPRFNEVNANSAIYKAVETVVAQIAAGDNKTAPNIIGDIRELLGLQELHINYNGDNVKIDIRTKEMPHQVGIYNGPRNAENLVGSVMQSLQAARVPLQVSRKYINTIYKGQDYNRMIGELAQVNLHLGDTHTVSDWFTISPLDSKGRPIRTVSPRNLGRNPNANGGVTTINFNGNQVQVNLKAGEVFYNGQAYHGERANAALAYAYGVQNNINMTRPYQTEWGYFNPVSMKFETAPQETVMRQLGTELVESETSINSPSRPTETPKTEGVDEKAAKLGLLTDPLSKDMWQYLPEEVKKLITDKKGPIPRQYMDRLKLNYSAATHEFNKPIENILGIEKYREVFEVEKPYNLNKELAWLSRVLPQFRDKERVQLIDGLTSMDGSLVLYGMFKQGVIYLNSENQTRGTVYHEAFHAVFNTLMSEKEVKDTYALARNKWGDLEMIELEERLAEDFRQYVEYGTYTGEGIRGALTKIWRKLKRLVNHLLGKESSLDRLYYDINKGSYSKRVTEPTDVSRYRVEQDDDETFKAIRKIQKIVNGKDGFNVGEIGVSWLIKKEDNNHFFVINRAAQRNRNESHDGNYGDTYYHSNEVLAEVERRLEKAGLRDAVTFEKYGVTYRVRLVNPNMVREQKVTGYNPVLTNTEDDILNIRDYHDDFSRLDPEEQMIAYNNGLQSADQWEELTEAEKENFKVCHFI